MLTYLYLSPSLSGRRDLVLQFGLAPRWLTRLIPASEQRIRIAVIQRETMYEMLRGEKRRGVASLTADCRRDARKILTGAVENLIAVIICIVCVMSR
ncbi:MAG: hypothetical protein ACKV2Q_14455, partial [Planctomycetaceae bacterium]